MQQAVQELHLAQTSPKFLGSRGRRIDRHRLINNCFGDLLTLLSQRADHGLVMVKVEELHGLVESLFAKRQSQGSQDSRSQ